MDIYLDYNDDSTVTRLTIGPKQPVNKSTYRLCCKIGQQQ